MRFCNHRFGQAFDRLSRQGQLGPAVDAGTLVNVLTRARGVVIQLLDRDDISADAGRLGLAGNTADADVRELRQGVGSVLAPLCQGRDCRDEFAELLPCDPAVDADPFDPGCSETAAVR